MKNGKKKAFFKYFGPLVIVMAVILLQLNTDPAIRTILSSFLVVCSLASDAKKAMFILLLIMPVATEINFFGNISLTVSIAFLNSVKYFLFRGKISQRSSNCRKKWGIFALALLIYSGVIYYLADTNEQLLYTVKLLSYLVFIEAFLTECKEKHKAQGILIFSSILRILGAGILIAFVCLMISGGQLSSSARFSFGDLATANNTGIQSSFVVVGIILLHLLKSGKKTDYIIAASCCIVSFVTQSRTAILMLGVAVMMYIVLAIIKGRFIRAILIALPILASFAVLLQMPAASSYYDSISSRFQVDDMSNGRYEIWDKTISQMNNNNSFLLIGAGDYYNLDFAFGGKNEPIVAHNFLIETWVIYGVIGIIFLFILLWSYIKEVIFMNILNGTYAARCLYVFVPILTLLLGLSFSHHFIGRANVILFICSFIPIACVWPRKLKEIDDD